MKLHKAFHFIIFSIRYKIIDKAFSVHPAVYSANFLLGSLFGKVFGKLFPEICIRRAIRHGIRTALKETAAHRQHRDSARTGGTDNAFFLGKNFLIFIVFLTLSPRSEERNTILRRSNLPQACGQFELDVFARFYRRFNPWARKQREGMRSDIRGWELHHDFTLT